MQISQETTITIYSSSFYSNLNSIRKIQKKCSFLLVQISFVKELYCNIYKGIIDKADEDRGVKILLKTH